MFRNKCAKCEKTWSKCRFIGWEGKSLGRKCYNKVKRESENIYFCYSVSRCHRKVSLQIVLGSTLHLHVAGMAV